MGRRGTMFLDHVGGITYPQPNRLWDVARARRGALASKTESVPANSKQSYRIRPGEHDTSLYSQRATAPVESLGVERGARYVQVPVTLRQRG